MQAQAAPVARLGLILASFAAIYLVWGSTYYVIAVAIETLPPFVMAGARFLAAGLVVFGWARWRGAPRPRASHWVSTGVVGILMLVGGNGLVTWAEQSVPSSIAALLITTVPLWMTMLDGLYGGRRPRGWTWLGVILGFAGVVVLVRPSGDELGGLPLLGSAALLLASFSWANGSLLSRRLSLPQPASLAVAMEMIVAGAVLLALGSARGEWEGFAWEQVSLRSLLAVIYLIVFGSIIALSAYMYLLRRASAAAVSTYAFVNPLVAVALGWWVAREPITPRVLGAAGLILAAVAVILWAWRRQEQRSTPVFDRPDVVAESLQRQRHAEA